MLVTKNLLRLLVTGMSLYLLLFNSIHVFSNPALNSNNIIGQKTVSFGANDYDIVVDVPISGYSVIRAFQSGTLNKPTEDILFFIILPDGNFIYLAQNISDQNKHYQTSARFQNTAGVTYNINEMQITAFKKSDPTPPPGLFLNLNPQYGGASNTSFTPATTFTASDYLGNTSLSIKIGSSWTPWDYQSDNLDQGEFYYLIISFANRSSNTIASGRINLDSCEAVATGYAPVKFTAYNRQGGHQWEKDITTNSSNTFSFQDLKPEEVRHIYVKMKIVGTFTSAPHRFIATMSWDTFNVVSECLRIMPGAFPHDPNNKRVDQAFCTLGGQGYLIYTVTYQNIGGAFADKVVICDEFPGYVKSTSLNMLDQSDNINPTYFKICHPWFGLCNKVKFTMGNYSDIPQSFHRLAGLTQSSPRRYSYDETIGWLQFKVSAQCPWDPVKLIENKAKITFFDENNVGQPDFTTNPAITKPDDKERPDQWIIRGRD